MYREILLSPADRPMHRFLWRKEVGEPWQDYQMERVTFGVTSSPYMAIKTLMQVADDFASEFPEAQRHIKNSFYVDDFFGGANSVSEASLLRKQMTNILSKGGFSLRKWRSSSQEVLDSIPQELREEIPDCKMLDFHSACYPKALGLVQADLLLKQRSQLRAYGTELNQLNSEPPQPLSNKCAILALQPEINHQGLLCVGGRLRKALIEEPAKHPVLLSAKDIYTKLLFEHYHNELMHGGPTVILAHSGSMFHVTGARRLARDVCRSCITCRKVAAKVGPQLMGQLPPERVDPDVAFTTTGLDYAGPYLLKEGYVRRPVEIKAWMAVFVCFTCKAVHLELVRMPQLHL